MSRPTEPPKVIDPSDPLHESVERTLAGMTPEQRVDWVMGLGSLVQDNLPPEPKREDFPGEDSFLEARSGWQHRIGRIKAIRSQISRKK